MEFYNYELMQQSGGQFLSLYPPTATSPSGILITNTSQVVVGRQVWGVAINEKHWIY